MKKHIRFVDHNIDRANGLTIEPGRFAGTVSLIIGGTVGRMTVNAQELLAAVSEVTSARIIGINRSIDQDKEQIPTATKQRPTPPSSTKGVSGIPRTTSGRSSSRPKTHFLIPSFANKSANKNDGPGSAFFTLYEDKVISIVSPEIAAKKLKRSVSEINNRRCQLGLI